MPCLAGCRLEWVQDCRLAVQAGWLVQDCRLAVQAALVQDGLILFARFGRCRNGYLMHSKRYRYRRRG